MCSSDLTSLFPAPDVISGSISTRFFRLRLRMSSHSFSLISASPDGDNCLIDYKVKNTSKDKTIVGYQADVIILNDFEDEVIKTTMEDTEIVIAPNSIEDRQFLMDPPWGTNLEKIRGAKLKGTVMITKVLYSDGSLEKGKEPSKVDASKK